MPNDTFLRALRREPVDYTPVWMMRQAGRYLPEYRATRAQAGGIQDLFANPELACEVTLQPLERFELDAAILFSDILTIPDAMGLGLYFAEGEGPKFRSPIASSADVERLEVLQTSRDLPYVIDAVSLIRKELNNRVPLIGFSGSPWTLATYMVEGGTTRDFAKIKTMAFTQPEVMHQLLSKLADSVVDYLSAQIRAGAQAVQIFDTWGGVLSPKAYELFSLAYMRQIIEGLRSDPANDGIPIIMFTKNGGLWIEEMAASGCDCLGLDWTMSIGAARDAVGDKVALQGNMDPGMLRASPEAIRAEVGSILESYGNGPGHVFNLGHGITPDINPDNAKAFIDAVHELSPAYHQ
ncbi:MAG: uroporphyrinogen decarboxylase [Pseudomonadales bacterium]